MRIHIVGCADSSAAELLPYAEQRLRSALGHLERRIDYLMICVTPDRPGPSPTASGKRCRILVRLADDQEARVEDRSADGFPALDRAAEQLGRDLRMLLGTPSPAAPSPRGN